MERKIQSMKRVDCGGLPEIKSSKLLEAPIVLYSLSSLILVATNVDCIVYIRVVWLVFVKILHLRIPVSVLPGLPAPTSLPILKALPGRPSLTLLQALIGLPALTFIAVQEKAIGSIGSIGVKRVNEICKPKSSMAEDFVSVIAVRVIRPRMTTIMSMLLLIRLMMTMTITTMAMIIIMGMGTTVMAMGTTVADTILRLILIIVVTVVVTTMMTIIIMAMGTTVADTMVAIIMGHTMEMKILCMDIMGIITREAITTTTNILITPVATMVGDIATIMENTPVVTTPDEVVVITIMTNIMIITTHRVGFSRNGSKRKLLEIAHDKLNHATNAFF